MPRFPRYGFPFQYYRPYNYKPHTPIVTQPPLAQPVVPPSPPPKSIKSPDPVWFDLFGIKLYFDDVLILSLLFFLYKAFPGTGAIIVVRAPKTKFSHSSGSE